MIKKGTEHFPAKPQEITNLQAQVKTVAMVPIIVGDHRLAVEIVTPKTDFTLSPDKYATIDSRLTSRLYQMFMVHGGSGSPRSDDSVKLAKVIARGMESRRYLLKRALERFVFTRRHILQGRSTESVGSGFLGRQLFDPSALEPFLGTIHQIKYLHPELTSQLGTGLRRFCVDDHPKFSGDLSLNQCAELTGDAAIAVMVLPPVREVVEGPP